MLCQQVRRYADCDNTQLLAVDPCPRGTVNGSDINIVSPCTKLRTFDYFTGSEAPYILTFAAVGLFIICKCSDRVSI